MEEISLVVNLTIQILLGVLAMHLGEVDVICGGS